jgi:exosome complex component RRP41|tara:strand:- start:8562 stop:9284 length:723 start_codon:yes stop_codon:yes gene_type:complete
MKKIGQPKKFIIKGKRLDGRKPDEMREVKIKAGVLERPDGSAYLEWGGNKVLAACYGPREVHPRHLSMSHKALLRCTYNMAPFSVNDRKRPGPDRRSTEISKVTRQALEPVVLTNLFPKTAIDVFIEILQANAGTRCTGITAASVAIADAGIPMKDLIPACAAGKVGGEIVLDMFDVEDNYGEADLPISIMPKTGDVSLLQMDGNFTEEEFKKALNLAINGCKEIHKVQVNALKEKYGGN